jgi:signal transduction histidine kinase
MTTQPAGRRIDWSQLWYPGPKRAYTADEMARAGGDGPSPTLVAISAVNFASVAFVVLQLAPAAQTARLTTALAALAVLGSAAARWLWWRPWRRALMTASLGLALSMIALTLLARWLVPQREDRLALGLTLAVGCAVLVVCMWFVVAWRSEQIDGRLREQAERDKAIEMAQRLAGAQLEPHFLFNTLASVQHWVNTKDDRAAPLLDALTGYLRATLPMFKKPLLPAREELLAVERYLQVMQARLGANRLQWHVDVDAALLARVQLPPGVLLTLVENAVAHGVEPQISGGHVSVQGCVQGEAAVFTIIDNGPGLAANSGDGIGLSNARQRLQLTCGDAASLTLMAAPAGGCQAEVRLPWTIPS